MRRLLFVHPLWLVCTSCALASSVFEVTIPCASDADVRMVLSVVERQPWIPRNSILVRAGDVTISPLSYDESVRLRDRIESELNLCAVIVSCDVLTHEDVEDGDSDQEGLQASAADRDVDEATSLVYTDPNIRRIISHAVELFATRYKWGGENIRKGIDCSFFVQYIFSRLGIALPRTSREQFKVGREIAREDLRCGDLVFFKTLPGRPPRRGRTASAGRINHVGIYLKNGEFIHAARGCNRVTITSLDERYYDQRFAGARRVLE